MYIDPLHLLGPRLTRGGFRQELCWFCRPSIPPGSFRGQCPSNVPFNVLDLVDKRGAVPAIVILVSRLPSTPEVNVSRTG
jgi:hypothetical protein